MTMGESFYALGQMKGQSKPLPLPTGRRGGCYDSIVANSGIQSGPGRTQQHREFIVWNQAEEPGRVLENRRESLREYLVPPGSPPLPPSLSIH